MTSLTSLLDSLAVDGSIDRRTAVLVGVTGDGKSSTGNSVCGRGAFKVSGRLASVTRQQAFADYRTTTTFWRVIDTVGLEDTCLPRLEVLRRFSSFADNAAEGIDCFLFVVRWGRFKPEHDGALATFARNVGAGEALSRTILVFTHCEEAPESLAALVSDAATAPATLRAWVERVGAVVGVDNNKAPDEACRRIQAAMDAAVRRHGGHRYSNAALDDAKERRDRSAEEERAAFADAVSDWRKTSGPLVIEREPAARPRQATRDTSLATPPRLKKSAEEDD